MNQLAMLLEGDAVHLAVAALLLLMSVASWTVMLWKALLLWQAGGGVRRGVLAFWQAARWDDAALAARGLDGSGLLAPLLDAAAQAPQGTMAAAGTPAQQHMRGLRGALDAAGQRLQYGQVVLASTGATAPFVGLLGTVWGIYHALLGIADVGQVTLGQVAAPVGQALIMTAAGLAVAIPAVLGYNLLGRWIARIEADLEGFAFDLHALRLGPVAA